MKILISCKYQQYDFNDIKIRNIWIFSEDVYLFLDPLITLEIMIYIIFIHSSSSKERNANFV